MCGLDILYLRHSALCPGSVEMMFSVPLLSSLIFTNPGSNVCSQTELEGLMATHIILVRLTHNKLAMISDVLVIIALGFPITEHNADQALSPTLFPPAFGLILLVMEGLYITNNMNTSCWSIRC